MRAHMGDVPEALLKRWIHSFEEDSGEVIVYRPESFDFPPARGRDGIELTEDGRAIQINPGPTDAPTETEGRWHVEEPNRLSVDFPSTMTGSPSQAQPYDLEIVRCTDEVLQVRRRPA
jgi:hypothetical protein